MPVTRRLTDFYETLNTESLHQLGGIYTPEVELVDPVGTHQGLAALETYFRNLMTNCDFCKFRIHSSVNVKEDIYMTWTMSYAHARLNSARPIDVDGISVMRMEGNLVNWQRDYYDMGSMLYEHVPVLGSIISALRRRLAA